MGQAIANIYDFILTKGKIIINYNSILTFCIFAFNEEAGLIFRSEMALENDFYVFLEWGQCVERTRGLYDI